MGAIEKKKPLIVDVEIYTEFLSSEAAGEKNIIAQ